MNHGLKSLAQELPKYGRYGDSIVAHINPQEAALLKSLGGSGTINPTTGLPEFGMFGIGGGGGFLGTGINKNASDPVSNALSNNPISKTGSNVVQGAGNVIDSGLVNLDKAVGKAIPGGWGTVASVAGSAMGLPTPMLVGLGALNGSGVMRKGGSFNMQGAIMGGAMAYGMSELGDYMRSAAPGIEGVTPSATVDAAGNLINPATGTVGSGLAGNASSMVFDPSTLTSADVGALNSLSAPLEAGAGAGLQVAPPPSIGSQIMSGNFGDALTQAGQNISQGASNLVTGAQEGISNLGTKAGNLYNTAINPSTYEGAIDTGMSNASQTGSGLKNLLGAGDITAKEAAKLAATSGVNPLMASAATLYGATGMMALDEQRKYLNDQLAANKISQDEYNSALAEVNRSTDVARRAVAEHPFDTNPDRTPIESNTSYAKYNPEENLYSRLMGEHRQYAAGGEVKGYAFGGMLGNIGALSSILGKIDPQAAASTTPAPTVDFRDLKSEGIPSGVAALTDSVARSIGGKSNFSGAPINLGITLYDKRPTNDNIYDRFVNKQYAVGGSVDDEPGMDDVRGLASGNLQNGFMGGGIMGYAAGGMPPRFLSGGGDGMSDSIPASINGKQEARLADGEFVISSDVVSGLGNGSSKAGAKQLYAMMDRVRAARTGKKKQAPAVNAKKLMPV